MTLMSQTFKFMSDPVITPDLVNLYTTYAPYLLNRRSVSLQCEYVIDAIHVHTKSQNV